MTELGCSHLFPDFGKKNLSVLYISARDDEAQQGGGQDTEFTLLGFDKKTDSPPLRDFGDTLNCLEGTSRK